MKSFSELGHNVTIFVIRPEKKTPTISNFQENSLNVYEIHPPFFTPFNGKRGIGKYVNYFLCLFAIQKLVAKIMKKDRINYIYSYMPGIGTSFHAMKIKSKFIIKHVLDFADFHVYVRPKRLAIESFRNADNIITITNYLKNYLIEKKISEDKISIISNGVDLDMFDPKKYDPNEINALRKSFGAKNLIFFSGALHDLNIIFNSAKYVIDEIPDTKYIIIGDHRDPNRSKDVWQKKIQGMGLSRYFEFLGKKSREEIPKLLLCADICIDSFPNEPYYAAAHPIKLLEYGACGKPVVATDVYETRTLLDNGKYGLLSKPDDPYDFADKIIRLLNNHSLRNELSSKFYEHIKHNFTWEKIALDLQNSLSD